MFVVAYTDRATGEPRGYYAPNRAKRTTRTDFIDKATRLPASKAAEIAGRCNAAGLGLVAAVVAAPNK